MANTAATNAQRHRNPVIRRRIRKSRIAVAVWRRILVR
jgi:hypothetical protein